MKIRFCTSLVKYLLVCAIFLAGCGKKDKQLDNNKDEIAKQSKAYVEAFNDHDSDKLAALFSENAVLCNFTNRVTLHGRDKIAQYYKEKFQNDKDIKLKLDTGKIKFDKNGNAIGTSKVLYKTKSNNNGAFKVEYSKQNGVWLIQKLVSIEDMPHSSNFDKLKDLSFFVGTWLDHDENIDMNSSFKWEKGKNFLVQKFSMDVLGFRELKGKQYIGWNPAKKRIESWIHDSDGGFGVSIWTKKDGSWYVHTIFTLPDGKRAISTNIYTPVDKDTYTFSSVNREIGGSVLPDIGPFTVVRKK